MAHTMKTFGTFGLLVSLLWLTACSAPTPTTAPTPDLNPLRTEVAGTVFAQVIQDLAKTPSATVAPSPTAPPPPTATATIAPSPMPSATPNITGTVSTATTEPITNNKAEWVSQSVPDDTTFTPGATFTMTWTLKNVGVTTWTADYMLRFYSGDTFGAPKEIPLGKDVTPGETVDILLKMKAPSTLGTFQSVWVMATENRGNFKEPVYLQIRVARPGTATPTP